MMFGAVAWAILAALFMVARDYEAAQAAASIGIILAILAGKG